MDTRLDYYALLHVHPDAPLEIIKASYRTLMQKLRAHPDLGGDAAHAAQINAAFEILSDPEERAAYDRQRTAAPSSPERDAAGAACLFCGQPLKADVQSRCSRCNAPLAVCSSQPGTAGERAQLRLQRSQPVRLRATWGSTPADGRTRDISTHGMLLETTLKVEQNQRLLISCAACDAVARVAHVSTQGALMLVGVEFERVIFHRVSGTFVSARA